MHLNRLAHAPTPIFFGGWVYRLFKHFTNIPRSFERSPWSGRVDYHICRAMNLLYEAEDGTVSFQRTQGYAWNPQEALVLHAPPPHFQYPPQGDPGQSSSQGGGFPNFQSLHDLLQENLMCTGLELSSATLTIYKMISVASGSTWRGMGAEVMVVMKTWSRRLGGKRGWLVMSPQV
ncbi:hypothetical protein HanHA300_Chr01g0010361 [Helianthus annuus]|nr:hypothetical protein HanHA300_Chr01g0010361 [Helianthus annuus]